MEKALLTLLIAQKGVDSEYGIAIDLQEKLRLEGKFCPWLKIGRKVFYVRKELDNWIKEQQAKTMAGRGDESHERLWNAGGGANED